MIVGQALMVAPVTLPGIHVNVVPGMLLLTDNEEQLPVQMAAGDAKGVSTGKGFTLTVTQAVSPHPEVFPITE